VRARERGGRGQEREREQEIAVTLFHIFQNIKICKKFETSVIETGYNQTGNLY